VFIDNGSDISVYLCSGNVQAAEL